MCLVGCTIKFGEETVMKLTFNLLPTPTYGPRKAYRKFSNLPFGIGSKVRFNLNALKHLAVARENPHVTFIIQNISRATSDPTSHLLAHIDFYPTPTLDCSWVCQVLNWNKL